MEPRIYQIGKAQSRMKWRGTRRMFLVARVETDPVVNDGLPASPAMCPCICSNVYGVTYACV